MTITEHEYTITLRELSDYDDLMESLSDLVDQANAGAKEYGVDLSIHTGLGRGMMFQDVAAQIEDMLSDLHVTTEELGESARDYEQQVDERYGAAAGA